MEGGAVGHNFERDHPCQVSFFDDFFGFNKDWDHQ
jgi:hypothetical protein